MGYSGSVVFVHHEGDVLDLESIGERSQGLEEATDYAGGWQLAWFEDTEISDDDETLAEITAETGQGCLLFVVLDSSKAIVAAHSPATGLVRAAIARDWVIAEIEWMEPDAAQTYPEAAVAAPRLVERARSVGATPDPAEVLRQLERRPSPFATDIMVDLLAALGFGEA